MSKNEKSTLDGESSSVVSNPEKYRNLVQDAQALLRFLAE